MKKVFVILIGLVFVVQASAQEISLPLKSHPKSKKWENLFASDLSNATYPKGIWSFDNGVLTATEDKNIWTIKEYQNFILDLEFKTDEGTNSGVVVYCSDKDKWIPNSVEIQIADDFAKKWADSPKTWQCGAIFGHLAAKKSVVKKTGEWNRYTIMCKGQMIWVMLNGELVTEMNMALWTSATKNPDGSEIPSWLSTAFAQLKTQGYIGFQGKHAGAPVYFRNMKIKELK